MILCNDILYILSYIEAVYFYRESSYSVYTDLIIQILYIYIYFYIFTHSNCWFASNLYVKIWIIKVD